MKKLTKEDIQKYGTPDELQKLEEMSGAMRRQVETRWQSRVIANGWDEYGAEGAREYLQKYGKTMGEEKMRAFAEYAKEQGAREFSAEMFRNLEARFGYEYQEEEPKKRQVWECPRCGRSYDNKEDAKNCRR
jgi:rubrerythrin